MRACRPIRAARVLSTAAKVAALLLAGLLAALTAGVVPARGQGAQTPPHSPPVAAPVIDPFRPPEMPYGPGNRGLEYDTEPGTDVRASANGEVVFAGRIASGLHVTLLHTDGVRTSYSFLAEIGVVIGQRVRRGEAIGVAGELLHFGARRGDGYFDPAGLFIAGTRHVELLPLEIPPGAAADEEAAALRALLTGRRGSGLSLPGLGDALGWLADRGRVVQHYLTELRPISHVADVAWSVTHNLASSPPCSEETPPPRPASQTARIAVLVGGLGSSSETASIDRLRLEELGYGATDVVRFSYAGGRTPDSGADFASLPPRPYSSADTQGDLRLAARRLADAIERVAVARPGAVVDVYGHSMGGVVTRLAVIELGRRDFAASSLGLVATIASPHDGADLATAVRAANTTLSGGAGLEMAEQLLGSGIDPNALAVAQLSETSDLMDELADAGVPDGAQMVSIAARGDVIVPAPRSRVEGARNVTVPGMGLGVHGDMVGGDAVTEELSLALAGMAQRCVSPWDAVGDELVGHGIAYIEDLGGSALAQIPG